MPRRYSLPILILGIALAAIGDSKIYWPLRHKIQRCCAFDIHVIGSAWIQSIGLVLIALAIAASYRRRVN